MRHLWQVGRCVGCGAHPDWRLARLQCPAPWSVYKNVLCDHIRSCILSAGLSYAEVSRASNVPDARIRKIVRGTCAPLPVEAKKLIRSIPGLNPELFLVVDIGDHETQMGRRSVHRVRRTA